jgi:hypothetical protein
MIDMANLLIVLTKLAFVATVLTVALEQIFDTRFYQKWLGKGIDGTPSRFFQVFELRPWISSAVGVFLAWKLQLAAIAEGTSAAYIPIPDGLESVPDVLAIDFILTGLIIGGGTKAVKKVAKQFAATKKDLTGTLTQ